MNMLMVYDNSLVPNEIVREVIGQRGYGDVIVKRHLLKNYYIDAVRQVLGSNFDTHEFNKVYDFDALSQHIDDLVEKNFTVFHAFSDFIISNKADFALSLKKLPYLHEDMCFMNGRRSVAAVFSDLNHYKDFLQKAYKSGDVKKTVKDLNLKEIQVEGVEYIGEIASFVQCTSGNFDSRYFNSLHGNQYILRKSSSQKDKMFAEYKYYYLLPDSMKRFMVMPFDYRDEGDVASYAMERLYMTDVAIKWVHGSFDREEFEQLMQMYFYFFSERSQKEVSEEEYKKTADSLYINKVVDRISKLKSLKAYESIAPFVNHKFGSIDALVEKYFSLKKKLEKRVRQRSVSVIGHGDPCFSNAMYNRATKTLKFIDPKGAVTEEELWTNPYYDIAKLSHSVCGNYDFFNNAMFDISVNGHLDCELHIPFDNSLYKMIFKEYAEKSGYNYWLVRLYEASLFISMLPLHMDYPQKVFGFILNAAKILDEVENEAGV